MLGTAYKSGTDLEIGSSVRLLVNVLESRGVKAEVVARPPVSRDRPTVSGPAAFFLGCPEPEFVDFDFPEGSVVIDPWHVAFDRPGVEVVPVGEPPDS